MPSRPLPGATGRTEWPLRDSVHSLRQGRPRGGAGDGFAHHVKLGRQGAREIQDQEETRLDTNKAATNTAGTFRTQDEAPETECPQGKGSWAEPTDCSPGRAEDRGMESTGAKVRGHPGAGAQN